MKKVLIFALLISVVIGIYSGCSSKSEPYTVEDQAVTVLPEPTQTESEVEDGTKPKNTVFKTAEIPETETATQTAVTEADISESEEFSEQDVSNLFDVTDGTVSKSEEARVEATEMDFPPVENSETDELKEIAKQTEAISETNSMVIPPVQDKPGVITNTYSYKKLPENSKVIYSKILSAMKKHEEIVSFSKPVDLDKLMDIYSLIYSDEINMQYIGSSFKYDSNPVSKMKITYKYSQDFVREMNAKTERTANNIIITKITPDMTEYDIVKMFHDEIIRTCVYDAGGKYANMAYGALAEGRASCQGYAHALSYLCNKVGIENTFMTGFAGEPHMWNLINLEGNWYNIDLTGDDVETDIPDFISYNYFNVMDEELTDRQYYDSIVEKPVANSSEYNFFVRNGYMVSSKEAATQVVYNQYLDAVINGGSFIYLKCSDKNSYDEIYKYLFTDHNIFAIQLLVMEETGTENEQKKLQLVKNDLMHTFQIIIQ